MQLLLMGDKKLNCTRLDYEDHYCDMASTSSFFFFFTLIQQLRTIYRSLEISLIQTSKPKVFSACHIKVKRDYGVDK